MGGSQRTIGWILLFVLTFWGCETKPSNSAQSSTVGTVGEAPHSGNVQDVTFAQITDIHLFDAGKNRHSQAVYEEFLDNRAALHWAILEINRIDATVRRIDFVIFTGDWGLENVHLAGDPESPEKCKCPPPAGDGEGPIPAIPLEAAVSEVANELRALVVTKVYLVPGVNDICNGDPRDLHRYAEFILQLQQRLPGRVITDLTHSAELLKARGDTRINDFLDANGLGDTAVPAPPPPGTDEVQGFHLVGLNSASFEQKSKFGLVTADAPGHPTFELGQLQRAIANKQSYLIFTYMPDLKDPAPELHLSRSPRTEQDNQPTRSPVPAWDLESKDLKFWENGIVGRTELLGIFAGHLHSSDRSLYGAASNKHPLAVRPSVAAKTWVAPPLATKDQSPADGRTARGFLLATVTGTGASLIQPYWYVTLDQKAASEGDATLAEAHAEAREGNWDTATQKYIEAMKSSDSRVRASASRGYFDARTVMRTAWWQFGRFFPPIRWIARHPSRTVVLTLLILLFLLLFKLLRRLWVMTLLWLRALLMPPFVGRAHVVTPKKLTETTNAELFASQLSQGAKDVADVLDWFGVHTFAGSITLLALPSEVTQTLIGAFPEVGGVNINKIVAFLLAILRYFGWRVESQIGFCPNAPAAPGGAVGPAGEMRLFATLQWAWFTKGNWGLTRPARDAFDMSRTAFGLAARVLWEAVD